MPIKDARLIVFEGIDGCGKSTQLKLLEESLISKGFKTIVAREPGGAPGAEKIRELFLAETFDPVTQILLCTAARFEHMRHLEAICTLEKPHFVILDRFTDSTLAYQIIPNGLSPNLLTRVNSALQICSEPELTLIFDLDPVKAVRRKKARNKFDTDVAFLGKVRSAYINIANQSPHKKVLIDASYSIDIIFRKVSSEIKRVFGI